MPVYDIFLSYKFDDAATFANALNASFVEKGFTVWLDKNQIRPGDSILASIEDGMSKSIYALLIISENYFSGWAEQERRALFSKMASGKIGIIPVLYRLSQTDFAARSPMLADIKTVLAPNATNETVEHVVAAVTDAFQLDQRLDRLLEIFIRCVETHFPYNADIDLWLSLFDRDLERTKRAMENGADPLLEKLSLFTRYLHETGTTQCCFEEFRKLYLHLFGTGKLFWSSGPSTDNGG